MSAVYHDYVAVVLQPVDGDTGVTQAATTQARILSAAGDLAWAMVPYKCQVRRVAVLFTDSNATGGSYTFDQRILAGSDTGRVIFATLTKAAVNAQGKYYYEDPVSSVVLNEGDEVVLTGSAASGLVRALVLVERMPEVPANQGDMVAA